MIPQESPTPSRRGRAFRVNECGSVAYAWPTESLWQECRMTTSSSTVDPSLMRLYQSYADGRLGRREFIRRVSAMAAAGLSIPAWMLADPARASAAQAAAGTTAPMLDLAEWTYFFVGVERAELARATYVNGKQMYV